MENIKETKMLISDKKEYYFTLKKTLECQTYKRKVVMLGERIPNKLLYPKKQ